MGGKGGGGDSTPFSQQMQYEEAAARDRFTPNDVLNNVKVKSDVPATEKEALDTMYRDPQGKDVFNTGGPYVKDALFEGLFPPGNRSNEPGKYPDVPTASTPLGSSLAAVVRTGQV